LEELIRECGLRVRGKRVRKSGEEMVCIWEADGAPENHERLVEELLADRGVKGFRC
jgi:hypothetical protein